MLCMYVYVMYVFMYIVTCLSNAENLIGGQLHVSMYIYMFVCIYVCVCLLCMCDVTCLSNAENLIGGQLHVSMYMYVCLF